MGAGCRHPGVESEVKASLSTAIRRPVRGAVFHPLATQLVPASREMAFLVSLRAAWEVPTPKLILFIIYADFQIIEKKVCVKFEPDRKVDFI